MRRTERRKAAILLTGSLLAAGTLGWLAAYLSDGGFPLTGPPTPIVTLGTVGLACYTMVFLLGEAALLVLAVINIHDEMVHNRYKSLMLLVLYVFTLRYRRVLPSKFFTEQIVGPESGDKPREAGKHRQTRT